jgi:hypothetical protein
MRQNEREDTMSSFGAKLRTIPRPAWIVGFLLWAPLIPVLILGPMRHDPDFFEWPLAAKFGFAVFTPLFLLVYALLVGFIYADAKRRGMRHVMWAWLALVPYFVGVILYFILRDPLPTPCPVCRTVVPQAFAYCPRCGASVHPVCSQCGKPVQPDWSNCPHCGVRLPPPAAIPA